MPTRYGRIVIPIYRAVGGDAIDHQGTGVLIKATDRFWLFTAAHVLQENRAIFLPGSRQIAIFTDHFTTCLKPLDLAFIELKRTDAAVLETSGSAFLSMENIDASVESIPPVRCVFLGYPDGSVIIDGDERRVRAEFNMLISRFLLDHELTRVSVDPAFQVGAPIGKLEVDGEKLKHFRPDGLSGSAIMCVRSTDDVRLVGIVTDFDPAPARKMLIGTRLRPLLQELRRQISAE